MLCCIPRVRAWRQPSVSNENTYSTLKGFGSWRTLSGLKDHVVLYSQGSSLATTLGIERKYLFNPERVRQLANPFRVKRSCCVVFPGFEPGDNPRYRTKIPIQP